VWINQRGRGKNKELHLSSFFFGWSVVYYFGKPKGKKVESADDWRRPSRRERRVPAKAPRTKAKAEQDYREAVRLYKAKDYEDAWRRAAAVLKTDRRHWRAWALVGNCQYATGDTAGALKSYRQSLKINPDNPKLRHWVDQISK